MTRLLRLERGVSGRGATAFPKLSALAALAELGVVDLEHLATEELVQGPTMVETIKPLIAAGWVEKQVDSGDRRRVQLRLTPKGRKHLHAEQKRLNALLNVLEPRELQALTRATGILRDLTFSSTSEATE